MLAVDLVTQMLTFDPATRITVTEALDHPWLASYHEVTDEPECPTKFEAWRKIEELETLEEFREALWTEIEDYRKEVRGINIDLSAISRRAATTNVEKQASDPAAIPNADKLDGITKETSAVSAAMDDDAKMAEQEEKGAELAPLPSQEQFRHPISPTDPVVTYARRSSLMQPSRQASTYNSPLMSSQQHLPAYIEAHAMDTGGLGAVTFPTQGYVVPGRSRTTSIAGGEVARKLLRTLSTVSIYESAQGLPGGLAEIAPIGKYIMDMHPTAADAPPSEMPRDFGIGDHEMYGGSGADEGGDRQDQMPVVEDHHEKEKKEGRFRIA